MRPGNYLFSSEVVFPGHPDKVADQVSDSILDAHLAGDPNSRVACETLVANQVIMVAGEITSKQEVDYEKVARDAVAKIGYTVPDIGFDAENAVFTSRISPQSADIALGVDEDTSESKDVGAGDQGMMFGYATNETPELMPAAIMFSRKLMLRHYDLLHSGEIDYLRPDGKCQVTVEYEGLTAKRIHTVVLSAQTADVPIERIREEWRSAIVDHALPGELMDQNTVVHINPTGKFVIGGPAGDVGLTGRKIIVDTYGGAAPHGGGAFSGKDSTKVDRSAAYATRWVAKNVVAAGLADRCTVQVAYAIGVAHPVSLFVDCHGTEHADPSKIRDGIREVFDLRPAAILDELKLRRPIFLPTARDGHFGVEGDGYTWELTNKVDDLKSAVGA
ncbi:MAG: methionine adenosyltransferase [Planctomycetota bacterium]|jgi:S-adenosylmethionine synthetase